MANRKTERGKKREREKKVLLGAIRPPFKQIKSDTLRFIDRWWTLMRTLTIVDYMNATWNQSFKKNIMVKKLFLRYFWETIWLLSSLT